MSESYWIEPWQTLPLPLGTIYAQTFSPTFDHDCNYIRLNLGRLDWPGEAKLSIQYLKPDGTPTGEDITSHIRWWKGRPFSSGSRTSDYNVPRIRLVQGINYALLFQSIEYAPGHAPTTRYTPPPTGYSRGHLIKSTDGGQTWDTSDHGTMLFAEWGYPPVKETKVLPPIPNWAVLELSYNLWNTNACFRVATSEPCTLTLHYTDLRPTAYEKNKEQRGTSVKCIDHFVFLKQRSFNQLEQGESLYHTFFITGLKEGQLWWAVLTAVADFEAAKSTTGINEFWHPPAPPFTTIRRPMAPGDECNVPREIGDPCPNHWKNVDDVTPDGDLTCIYNSYPSTTGYWRDLYHIPDVGVSDLPIGQVHLTGAFRRQGGHAYIHLAVLAIKTHGRTFISSAFNNLPTWYVNRHWHLYVNPYTGEPWTYAEVNELQIGVGLRSYWGVGWAASGYCTQVYCRIIGKCEKSD